MTLREVVADAVRAIELTAEIQKLATKYGIRAEGLSPDEIHESAMEIMAPKDMDTVRSFPPELHSSGIEYLLYTLDRSVENGASGYCADWHAEESRKHVADLLGDSRVRTAKHRCLAGSQGPYNSAASCLEVDSRHIEAGCTNFRNTKKGQRLVSLLTRKP